MGAERLPARVLEELATALAPSFVLVRLLGAGGMGSVYLARDPVLKRSVAVKLLSPELTREPEARARFQREAQAVAAISHPNVVAVYSVGEIASGTPYFVMQFVGGRSMADRLREDGPLDVPAAERILGEVASALAAAHRQGIIHRDVKPANILWDDDGGRALVSDFGIASVRSLSDDNDGRLTQTGMAVGTPAYMSPEQLLAEPVTDKTDVYSLGLLGYELLTGAGPYAVSSPRELMAAHLRDAPRKLSLPRGEVDPELQSLLELCLVKDAAQRPTADEVAKRLSHGASVLLEWPPPGVESLHGALSKVSLLLAAGSFSVVTPLVATVAFSRSSTVRELQPPPALVGGIAGLGFIVLAVGLFFFIRIVREGARLMRAGYGWGLLFEAAADRRKDTGALITGAREYAALAPAVRSGLREGRVVAGALLLTGALLPPLGVMPALLLARTRTGPEAMLWICTLLPASLLVGAWLVSVHESLMVRRARLRLHAPARDQGLLKGIVDAWLESFERVRHGQRLGGGSHDKRLTMILACVLVALIATGSALVGYAALVASLKVESTYREVLPRFENVQERYSRALRLQPYRLAVDTSISALRAGEALHAIGWASRTDAPASFERAPSRPVPGKYIPAASGPSPLFPGSDPWWESAIRQAPRGFSREQREFLVRAANHAGLAEFAVLGRAASEDYLGVALRWPLPRGLTAAQMPFIRFGSVRDAAHANLAAAALDLADGRSDAAEHRLRGTIGAGLLMAEGNFLLENLIGSSVAGIGRRGLVAFSDATGKPEQSRILRAIGEAPDTTDPMRKARGEPSLAEQFQAMRKVVTQPGIVRGMRWEFAQFTLPYEPCSDLHQLVFGPRPDYYLTLREGRRALVRRASDSALYVLAEQALNNPATWPADGFPAPLRVIRMFGRAVDQVVGGRRFESCVAAVGVL